MVNWFENKQNFYGLTTNSENNVEVTEFENGKKRYILKNSTPKLNHTFSFLLMDKDAERNFWNWYADVLKSRTQTVELRDLITRDGNKEYRMTDEPTVNGSQYPKEVNVSVQEE